MLLFIFIDIDDRQWFENTSTPLHTACWRGYTEEVKWIVDRFGYQAFEAGVNGWTPLHAACYGGHVDIIKLLVSKYQCDASCKDGDEVTLLHVAAYKGHRTIIDYLIKQHSADLEELDSCDTTAFLYAVCGGQASTACYLYNNLGCSASQELNGAVNATLLACWSGSIEMVKALEQMSLFDKESIDHDGQTILHYACVSGSAELTQYIASRYDIEFSIQDRYGNYPVHLAAMSGSYKLGQYLINTLGPKEYLKTTNTGEDALCIVVGISYIRSVGTTKYFTISMLPLKQPMCIKVHPS